METVIAVLLALGLGFGLGARTGRKEEKKPPEPKTAHWREAELAQRRLETMMRNIESYDGTGFGQEELPGR